MGALGRRSGAKQVVALQVGATQTTPNIDKKVAEVELTIP